MGGIAEPAFQAVSQFAPPVAAALQAKGQMEELGQAQRQLQHEQAAADADQVARHQTRMEQLAQIIGGQRAGFSAAGVDPSSGSGAAVAVGSTRAAFTESANEADAAQREREWRRYGRQQLRKARSLVPWTAGASFAMDAAKTLASAGVFSSGGPAGAGMTTKQLTAKTGLTGGSSMRRPSHYKGP